MHRYTVKRINRIGSNTILLVLQPKSRRHSLKFYPGQYAVVAFKRGVRTSPVRCFSIVSSPMNPDELCFGIRVEGDFTTNLSELMPGDHVLVRGPYGEFVVDEEIDRRVIFIAGGIGITPFMSMISYATETRQTIPMTLLYSCKAQYDIPFYDELLRYQKQNPKFKAAYFITGSGIDQLQKNSLAIQGRINETHLRQLTRGQPNQFTYFVCGPKSFTRDIKKALSSLDTDPERIITEEFAAGTNDQYSILPKKSINKWTYGLTATSLLAATAFIMTIDLAHAVPKLLSEAPLASTHSSSFNSSQGQPSSSSAGSATAAGGSGTASSPSINQTSGSSASTQAAPSYQPPVTAVS